MKIAIMGSGGVGSCFGARLAMGGSDVAFIARGAHLDAMRKKGLYVQSSLGDIHLEKPWVTDDPAQIGLVDVVLVCVKLWDTEEAAHELIPIIGPETAVISLQNGVQKDDILRGILGSRCLLGGVCYISAVIGEPGVIIQTGSLQKIVFGEYDGHRSDRAEAFLHACQLAGIDATLSDDILKAIWEKFVFLTGVSAVTTAIQMPIGPIRANSQTRAFLLDLMKEVVVVGRAHNVALDPDYAQKMVAMCDQLDAQMTSSMFKDFERGRRLEVPWLSGGVVDLGRAVQISTPLNRAVSDILALYALGR